MKKYFIAIISLIACIVLGIWLYTYCTTPDNDLSEERIDNIGVKQPFKNKHNKFVVDAMIQLDGKTFYRSNKCKELIIRKDNKHNRITAVTLFKDDRVRTSRDIGIDSSKQDVIEAYGDTYKKSILTKNQTQYHYKDKENHIGMKFIFKDDKVKKIELFEE
ncbi:hypothetical protein ACMGE9_08555 [Macrococcus sp. EM39E]|uniref:hypothetical protein n=1 Tax=Macrococcus animalis TaxID=3395467 RepID=UPI0039BEC7D8